MINSFHRINANLFGQSCRVFVYVGCIALACICRFTADFIHIVSLCVCVCFVPAPRMAFYIRSRTSRRGRIACKTNNTVLYWVRVLCGSMNYMCAHKWHKRKGKLSHQPDGQNERTRTERIRSLCNSAETYADICTTRHSESGSVSQLKNIGRWA